jgi:hypothetical protein
MREVGRPQWQQQSGYHRRSLAETQMSRYKRLPGEKLRATDLQRQAREAFIHWLYGAQQNDGTEKATKLRRMSKT